MLAIAALVGKESLYLEEWFEYHKALGVGMFYIYTYKTDKATLDVLKRLSETGYIQYEGAIAEETLHAQVVAYDLMLETTRKAGIDWVAYIDVDEFIVPRVHNDILSFLEAYEAYSGVGVHWRLFGSNGYLDNHSTSKVLTRFTRCQNDVNPHIKSIVKPQCTIKALSPHHFLYEKGGCVDEKFTLLNGPIHYEGTTDLIQINHYSTKSKAECEERRSRPRADNGEMYNPEFFNAHDRNELEDLRAVQLSDKQLRLF